jgi:NHL repeat-containing protein
MSSRSGTYNNRIRRVDSKTGIITTVAGNGSFGSGGDNGPAFSAELRHPTALAFDAAGNLFISDTDSHRIRVVRGPIP